MIAPLAVLMGLLVTLAGCSPIGAAQPSTFLPDGSSVHTIGVDDIGLITAAVDDIGKNVEVDRVRVYATGMSNGAIMAYTLACETSAFAAIGPVSGTQLDPCQSPHPTSVMHIHGTSDPTIRYDGGPGTGVAHIDGPAVPDLDAFWRHVDQCGPPAVTSNGPVTTSTASCADNRAVVLMTVDGGGHQGPGFATATLWQFFAGRTE